jgi:transposase InsO family protein
VPGVFPVSIGRAYPAVPACHATCTTVLAGPKQAPVRKRIREIAKTWMRYRDRRIHVLLRRDGWRANIKRVPRLVVFTPVRLEGHSNSHCCFSSRSWSGSLIDNQLVVAGPFTYVSTNSVATTLAELAPRPHLRSSFRFAQENSAESCHWGASTALLIPASQAVTDTIRSAFDTARLV